MTLEIAGEFAEGLQSLYREGTALGPRSIQKRRRVTLGQYKTIIRGVFGIGDIVAHSVKKYGRGQVRSGHATGRVTRPGFGCRYDRMNPELVTHRFESVYQLLVGPAGLFHRNCSL
jgi:hypothetical protein